MRLPEPDAIHAFIAETPWSTLFHAYGSASDTPEHLRALVDGGDIRAALDHLSSAVVHQGTVWSATPPALAVVGAVLAQGDLSQATVRRLLAVVDEATSALELDWTGEDFAAVESRAARTFRKDVAAADDEDEFQELWDDNPEVVDELMRRAAADCLRLFPALREVVQPLDPELAAKLELPGDLADRVVVPS
ncbi:MULTISPECIES: hypothetical protein [Actinosynnema]|uniref:Uncharacterized protein n=1 Tax=Actinosynnema pretiosum TaxID=42197 RepID=A0A290Z2P4_9PSEU|nr:hypothetical protein [Actinosynnema pretiosum]ATE53278.1 hypothetical protein CNX65_08235 [Actinosynnema pretiosum]